MKNTLNIPRLRNPYWFVRKERALSPFSEQLTQENTKFVRELVHDKFGSPAIIKGVPTYSSPVSTLIKVEDLPKSEWTPFVRRTGVIAKKIGQYPLFKKDGTKVRTTLLQVTKTVNFKTKVSI